MEAGIRELKTNLSKYLRKVEEGDEVTVTRHGEPIGRIVPVKEREKTLREKLQAMQDAGLAEWNGKPLPPYAPTVSVRGDKLVSDMIIEDRR